MILCHCGVVSCRHVREAVEDGARSLSEVCRRTGAAQACGGCIFSVKQAIREYGQRGMTPIEEASGAAS